MRLAFVLWSVFMTIAQLILMSLIVGVSVTIDGARTPFVLFLQGETENIFSGCDRLLYCGDYLEYLVLTQFVAIPIVFFFPF